MAIIEVEIEEYSRLIPCSLYFVQVRRVSGCSYRAHEMYFGTNGREKFIHLSRV